MLKVQRATLEDPTEGLEDQISSLRTKMSRQKVHYEPFTDEQLQQIFDPRTYLAYNRDADYFWAPLIGIHTGLRLGELITLSLKAITQNPKSRIWSIEGKRGLKALLTPAGA